MIPQVRIAVRLMDRVRMFDEFEMVTLENVPDVVARRARSSAIALATRSTSAPCIGSVCRAAVDMVQDQILDEGSSVRTTLLEDGWLLLIRLDQRTGPALDLRHIAADLLAA